jgi:ribosome modulation factor
MQHKVLSNPAYLEGKVAFLENKHECPYQTGPEKGMWLAGQIEMREELRVLRESLSVQARDSRDGRRVPSVARHNSLQ